MNEGNTAEVIRDLASAAAYIQTVADAQAGIYAAKMSQSGGGSVLVDLKPFEHRLKPQRTRETVKLHDTDSLLAYVSDFKSVGSRIFFDQDRVEFVAVLDYPTEDETAWGEHVASMALRHSEEWKLWHPRSGKLYGQSGFGRFIEENIIDVVSPDGATLLEMVMTFEATKSLSFREATKLKNGMVQFSWVEDIKTGNIDIPDTITIKIPVFLGQAPREIQLRFRYTIQEQKLQLAYEFVRPERIVNEAAAEIVSRIRKESGLPVHLGSRLPLAK